jgi:hypothetical protein
MVSTRQRLELVENILSIGLTPLVFIHPYIHGLSKLDWIRYFKGEKRVFFSYKGFRYSRSMKELEPHIPQNTLEIYRERENEEVLVGEDFLLENLLKYIPPSNIVSFRNFIHTYNTPPIHVPYNEARRSVQKLLTLGNTSSSDSDEKVKRLSILRRVLNPSYLYRN